MLVLFCIKYHKLNKWLLSYSSTAFSTPNSKYKKTRMCNYTDAPLALSFFMFSGP